MRYRLAVAAGLVFALVCAPVAAQDPVVESTGLEALCEANAPDEVTRTTCLDIVQNVLGPAGGAVAPDEPPTLQELLFGAEDPLDYITFFFGEWAGLDDKGDRPKPGSKKWRRLADSTADELGAYLMSVESSPCTEAVILDMWGVYGAFRLAGAGAKAGDRLISDALTELFSGMRPQAGCGPGWVVQEER